MAATKQKKYIVIPRSQATMNEGFAFVSTGERPRPIRIPFEKPIALTDREVAALKRQKEAIEVEKQVSVKEIMENMQIPQAQANKIARAREANTEGIGKKGIQFVTKYIVTPV